MTFSPYECARGRISSLEIVHMSHIEMTKHFSIHFGILSPLFVMNRQMNQEEKGKKKDMNKDKR